MPILTIQELTDERYHRSAPSHFSTKGLVKHAPSGSLSSAPQRLQMDHSSTPSPGLSRHRKLESTRDSLSPRSDEDSAATGKSCTLTTAQVKKLEKRRLNTLAARKSRERRRKQLQELEETVARLTRECQSLEQQPKNGFQILKETIARLTEERNAWRKRSLQLERILSANGVPYPDTLQTNGPFHCSG